MTDMLCRHTREIASTLPDGKPALQCLSCFRIRPHPWNQTAAERRRWARKQRKDKADSLTYARDILEAKKR